MELGLDVGVASYWGDLDDGDWLPLGDLAAHYWFTDKLAAGLVVAGTNLRAEDQNVGFKTPLTAVMGRLKWMPFREMAVNPYLSMGLEWVSFNAEDSENDEQHPIYHDWSQTSDVSALALPFGVGLSHDINDNFALSLEALYHTSTTDFQDDWEGGDADDGWYTVTAGLAWLPGKPRDTDGCPDKQPELQVEAGHSIVLEGVNFDSGKSTLRPESAEPLGKVLRTLQENPEIEVEIQGHTDDQGKAQMNRELSQARADAVMAWLVERGIEPARLRTKGFGPGQPVADNATPDGRAQNRRIEFLRLK